MREVPKAITDIIPYAYSWARPRFAFIEQGLVFYQTRAFSNAGGCSHYISFPVNILGKNLAVEDQGENLSEDAEQAIKNGTVRQDSFRN